MASVRGTVVGADAASLRLVLVDGSDRIDTRSNPSGGFEFPDVPPGLYILSCYAQGFQESVSAVRLQVRDSADIGTIELRAMPVMMDRAVPVLTVCEALKRAGRYTHAPAVIVGVFKSGMDETLRLDCPPQPTIGDLLAGELVFPGSIGLTGPANPPDSMRDEVELKRQEVLKSGPPGAHPRPERVVGLYGIFVAPSIIALVSLGCCGPMQVETVIPPARLFGIAEKDLRVIR